MPCTRRNATRKQKTNHTTNLGNPGRHLKLRSWGVTTALQHSNKEHGSDVLKMHDKT